MTLQRELDSGYGALAVALAAVLAYALSLTNGFAFDDVVLIPNDPRVTQAQIGALLTRPYWNDSALGLYRPLTSVTFALDWFMANANAAWFHFTNLLWHGLASVLCCLLLMRFFSIGAALIGGLIFALHPVHVEAVANVVGRGELIAATFFFAACLVWTTDNIARTARLALTLLCYALAMLAKEGAVVLPAILVLLDLARGEAVRDYARRKWLELSALSVTLAAFMLLRIAVIGGVAPTRLDPTLEVATSTFERWLTALHAWPIYARVLFFPYRLLADYGPRIILPASAWTPAAVIGLTLLIASVVGGIVAIVGGNRRWALGLLWFPITILPVSNFIFPIGVIVAERTLYLPAFALCIAAAAAWQSGLTLSRSHTLTLATVILLALTIRTVTRISDWKNTDTIMLALVRDRPDSFRGQWHMARMARARGDAAGAVELYDRALRLWPYREGLVKEAAAYGTSKGRAAWARDAAFWGAQRWPGTADFHRLVAANAVDLGDTVTARRAVLIGLQHHPNDTILNQMRRAFGSP
ncbi:MAG: hypothetical protein ACT4O1_11770 [Gemmatimonadota bacterium]